MLHLAAGVLDLQHKFQKEHHILPQSENDKAIMAGKTSVSTNKISIPNEPDDAIRVQEPPGIENKRRVKILDKQPENSMEGHRLSEGKDELTQGKVERLISMNNRHLSNLERGRGSEMHFNIPNLHHHKGSLDARQDSPSPDSDTTQTPPVSPGHRDNRSCSPESETSDLHRSFSATPPLVENSMDELSVGGNILSRNHDHAKINSIMTDSGIYDHELIESDMSDSIDNLGSKFESKTINNHNAIENREKEKVYEINAFENICQSSPNVSEGTKSSHESTGSFDLSWYDSTASDFFINSAFHRVSNHSSHVDTFAEFEPAKQGHYFSTPEGNESFHPQTQQRKGMVMYIEEPKRKYSTNSSFTTDEDELAAYIYDPQINDSYNTCVMKEIEYLKDPFVELHRQLEEQNIGVRRKIPSGDPLEDPNFALPSSPSPLFIPPEYEDGNDSGEFFMQVVSPFGDVTSQPNDFIDYKFEMHDTTWGVSSGERYFDLFTGQRILSTIYEFEVSSEEDTESFRMSESRASQVEDFNKIWHSYQSENENEDGDRSMEFFRQDSLDESVVSDSFRKDSLDGAKERDSFRRDSLDQNKDSGTIRKDSLEQNIDSGSYRKDSLEHDTESVSFKTDFLEVNSGWDSVRKDYPNESEELTEIDESHDVKNVESSIHSVNFTKVNNDNVLVKEKVSKDVMSEQFVVGKDHGKDQMTSNLHLVESEMLEKDDTYTDVNDVKQKETQEIVKDSDGEHDNKSKSTTENYENIKTVNPCDTKEENENILISRGNESEISQKDNSGFDNNDDTSYWKTGGQNETTFTLIKNSLDSNAEVPGDFSHKNIVVDLDEDLTHVSDTTNSNTHVSKTDVSDTHILNTHVSDDSGLDTHVSKNVELDTHASIEQFSETSNLHFHTNTQIPETTDLDKPVSSTDVGPDIAIVVTTVEENVDSEQDFFSTDTFITTRDHYKCNETGECVVDTCNCKTDDINIDGKLVDNQQTHDQFVDIEVINNEFDAGKNVNDNKDLDDKNSDINIDNKNFYENTVDNVCMSSLDVVDTCTAHLSDDEAFLSDAETDITYISHGHDVIDGHADISDNEFDIHERQIQTQNIGIKYDDGSCTNNRDVTYSDKHDVSNEDDCESNDHLKSSEDTAITRDEISNSGNSHVSQTETSHSNVLNENETIITSIKSETTVDSINSETEATVANINPKTEATVASINSETEETVANVNSETDSTLANIHSETEATASNINSEIEATASNINSETEATASNINSETEATASNINSETEATIANTISETKATVVNINFQTEPTVENICFETVTAITNINSDIGVDQDCDSSLCKYETSPIHVSDDETEALVTNSNESELILVSDIEATERIPKEKIEIKSLEMENVVSIPSNINIGNENQTSKTENGHEETIIIDEAFNPIFSEENGDEKQQLLPQQQHQLGQNNHIIQEIFGNSSNAVVVTNEKCSPSQDIKVDILPSCPTSLIIEEKQPIINAIQGTDEIVHDIPAGGVARTVNVCVENLIGQDTLSSNSNSVYSNFNDQENDSVPKLTSSIRRVSRTAYLVEEECQRLKVNIGSRRKIQKLDDHNENIISDYEENTEEILQSEIQGEEGDTFNESYIDENFEICVPAIPPPKPKRLFLRRLSSEAKTFYDNEFNPHLIDIRSYIIDKNTSQSPIKPKRRKRSPSTMWPISPERKIRPVSLTQMAMEKFIENEMLTKDEKVMEQKRENSNDGIENFRSSSYGVVGTDGEIQGRPVGTGPESRDPGSQRLELNTNQSMPEDLQSYDTPGVIIPDENINDDVVTHDDDINNERENYDLGNDITFDKPIKISEIVASLVLESQQNNSKTKTNDKQNECDDKGGSDSTTNLNTHDHQCPSLSQDANEIVPFGNIVNEELDIKNTIIDENKESMNISTSIDHEQNYANEVREVDVCGIAMNSDGEVKGEIRIDYTEMSPRPPKRKKKSPPIMPYGHEHVIQETGVLSFDQLIGNETASSSPPPRVPKRTYRRINSLPRRSKSRQPGMSPGALTPGIRKSVGRSASTATCRPHSVNDLKFAVPEISSVINYDPLHVQQNSQQRVSVMLLEETKEPHHPSSRITTSTPHLRKRHHTAEFSTDKRKAESKLIDSFKRTKYFSLPRNLVKKLSPQTGKTEKDSVHCFPNLFHRKSKNYDMAYSPHKSEIPQIQHEPFIRQPSTGSIESFSNLFRFHSSMEYYEHNKSDDVPDINLSNNCQNPPEAPPRRHKHSKSPFETQESNLNEQPTFHDEYSKNSETENSKENSNNMEETDKFPVETDTQINQKEELRLSEVSKGHSLDDSGIGIVQEDLSQTSEIDQKKISQHENDAYEIQNALLKTNRDESLMKEELLQVESESNKNSFILLSRDISVATPTSEQTTLGSAFDAHELHVLQSEKNPWEPPAVPLQTWAERQGLQEPLFPPSPLLQRQQELGLSRENSRRYFVNSMVENNEDTPSPGPPVDHPEKEDNGNKKSSKRDEDTRVQQDRCIEVYPETVRQRQRNMMTSSNKVDIKNWTSSNNGNDTLTSPSKVKKYLPSVKALRNQFETGKANNNRQETNGNNNGTLSRKSSSSNSSLASSTLEKTSSTNSLNSANGSMENLLSSNIDQSRQIDPDEPVEPIFSQFKQFDEELRELMSKPPSTTGWNPRSLLKRLYYVPDAPKHHSQGTTYINIEGYLEKLPSGRKKATFWNAWKRRYFVAKDGVLYYYQNPQTDKASMKMTLMGGKVECMEPNMVSVDDGSRESKAGAMIGIDDGKGHYVVVRCSSKQEADRWRRALETHTVEDFASQYVQPWPIPTNPALLRDTLVIDIGSSSIRAGVLATQATLPQIFVPSVVATERESRRQIWGCDALTPDVRSVSSVSFPVRPSHKISKYSVDLSAVSSLLQKAFADLKVDPKNYNVQLSVPRILNPNTQAELLRILFDKYGVKSVNLTHQSILALYAYNATSGIVVDIGERMDVVPVIDGYIVDGGVSRVPYGGYRILDHLRQFLYMRNISLINEVESYIIRYVLENICYCAHHYNTEKARCTNNPDNFEKGVSLAEHFPKDCPYESISLDFGRFQATEGLFNPDAWGLDHPGIHKLVHKAIMECSMDIRKEMSRSIFLAGGVTQLPGLVDRLTTEIDNLTPPAIRPKVHASPYRYHAAYIGACVLAESPAFTQSRITREDWNKHGNSALRKWSL